MAGCRYGHFQDHEIIFSNILSLIVLLGQALIAIPAGAYYATVTVILSKMFPIKLRCTVLSVLYSTAASLSAGLAPLISYTLVKKTGLPSSPSFLVYGLIAAVFIAIKLKRWHEKNQNFNLKIYGTKFNGTEV